jgi:ATP-dependent DNA helicase DinG
MIAAAPRILKIYPAFFVSESMLSTELKSQIQGAYSRFLEAKSLKPRYGQRLMIAEIAKVLGTIKTDDEGKRLGDPAVVAVEAGTGTGKTVAYSLATIPTAKAAGKRLVIATATVALQEQIVHKDLPDLLRNSGLNFSFALAKGRGRYLCLSKLDHLLQDGAAQSATAQLFEEEGFRIDVDEQGQKLFTVMIEKLAGNKWDGDRDSWPEELEDVRWAQLTTDHSQCTNRHCPNFQQCAFYKAREGMGKVDVIVTNHDMVLADLALGGGAVLPDPRETIYVFDEGHHLPDKAIGHFAHFTRLRSTADWLTQIDKNLTKLLAQNPLPGDLGRLIEQVPELARELKTQQQFMFAACEQIADFKAGEDMEGRERPRHRFVGGVVPEHLTELGLELKKGFSKLNDLFTGVTELLKEAMDGEGAVGIASHQAEEWYPLFGSLMARAKGNWELWLAFTAEDPEESPPMARWLTLAESGALFDIEVNASPILAAETLRRNLWNVAHGALVTSATLTALGTFDRYRMRAGLPKVAVAAIVPSPFHHADAGLLRVPDLKADPREAAAHTAAIIRELPGLVAGSSRYVGVVLLTQADAGRVRWAGS